MLISFLTLILSFCIGILSGLFFRKRVPNFLGVVLACVIGAFIGILATYLILKFYFLCSAGLFASALEPIE